MKARPWNGPVVWVVCVCGGVCVWGGGGGRGAYIRSLRVSSSNSFIDEGNRNNVLTC